MMSLAREAFAALDAGKSGGGQRPDRGDEVTGAYLIPIFSQNVPSRPIITKVGGRDEAVEANMLAEAETVGDMAEIALELGLAGETLGPVAFGEELWREGVGVGIAFRVAPGSGITNPPTVEIGRAACGDEDG